MVREVSANLTPTQIQVNNQLAFQQQLIPQLNSKMSSNELANTILNSKGVDGDSAIPFCGCVCCFNACYLEFPACIGCAGKRSCLCCHSDFLACKFPTEEADKDNWFIWDRGQTVCSDIKNCCSTSLQCFCFDIRASLPPTEEIPCLVTLCFFTVS